MSAINPLEKRTQHKLIDLFTGELGYRYLGNRSKTLHNQNVDHGILTKWLQERGHNEDVIGRVIHTLDRDRVISSGSTLYDTNQRIYERLRYGIEVAVEEGGQKQTIDLIDWNDIEANDFAVAEEVTVEGQHKKRPDLVLYVNGIAVGIIELKRSTVSVGEGIRQNMDSQQKQFIRSFFTTIQLVMAGNETEGLRYGVIGTPEKYYLRWREPSEEANPLLREASQLLTKQRLLELIRYFIVFDSGTKKIARHNQYFGVNAAKPFVRRRDGGIIWHTQGSGKSLTMVWLAKWIRENITGGRVLIVTDRKELDEQIEGVFKGVNETIKRSDSGHDLVSDLNSQQQWLMCSLVHKFGPGAEGDIDTFIKDIEEALPPGFEAKGELFVFVDECHRTQSGKLHAAMNAILPDATFIGFTGTPLLARDKKSSIETFGPFIHTYKYDEAVRDGVVLDLVYEARDIDQTLKSPARIDKWFESKTKGLTPVAQAQLKKKWGTMKQVLSSLSRLEMIADDILLDMNTQPRLVTGNGNAMLVTASISDACRIYDIFSKTELAGHCAIVTSYRPDIADIKGEDAGEGETDNIQKYATYRKMLAEFFDQDEDKAMRRIEEFETKVKKRFIDQPGQLRLLIVVDKLLTGFDAPPATYLYIDKSMQDHGLFQAICRVNRLDGEDKEYGHIVDYKDLFSSLEGAIADYTGDAFDGFEKEDVEGLLTNRLELTRRRLDEVREQIKALCEPIGHNPKPSDYLQFFCPDDATDEGRVLNERKRVGFYTLVSSYVRAYAELANDMEEAGYSEEQHTTIRNEVEHYEAVRQQVKLGSGDYIDLKKFEPAMRNLLDRYIEADPAEPLGGFAEAGAEIGLVALLVDSGPDAVIEAMPKAMQGDQAAVAEAIVNNVRRVIIDEQVVNPAYYEKMSKLLDDLIEQRRAGKLAYKEYLDRLADLATQITDHTRRDYPDSIKTQAQQALYDAVGSENLAIYLDIAIKSSVEDDWRGNLIKERKVKRAISQIDGVDEADIDDLFEIAKAQRYDY